MSEHVHLAESHHNTAIEKSRCVDSRDRALVRCPFAVVLSELARGRSNSAQYCVETNTGALSCIVSRKENLVQPRMIQLLILMAFLAVCCTLRLSAADREQKVDKSTVKEELEKLEDDWAAAVETNDPDRIGRFFTDDFLFVGAGGILQDRRQHLDDFRSGRLKVESVKIELKTTHVYEGAAVVSSRVTVRGKLGTRDISGPYQFTDTWLKRGGRWLAIGRQQTGVALPPASGVVRDFFSAFAKGDIPNVLNTLSPDIDWLVPGPSIIPYAGPRHGRDEVQGFFKTFSDAVDVQKFEPRDFVEQDEKVVVQGSEDLRVKGTGKSVHNEWTLVFVVSAGKISRFRSYEDTAALASAFSRGVPRGNDGPSVQPSGQLDPKREDPGEGKKKVNGVELFYKALGSGEPIVILHGGPGLDHSYLLPQFAKLASHHRLIFYNGPSDG
jgi:uncharacterized protein